METPEAALELSSAIMPEEEERTSLSSCLFASSMSSALPWSVDGSLRSGRGAGAAPTEPPEVAAAEKSLPPSTPAEALGRDVFPASASDPLAMLRLMRFMPEDGGVPPEEMTSAPWGEAGLPLTKPGPCGRRDSVLPTRLGILGEAPSERAPCRCNIYD